MCAISSLTSTFAISSPDEFCVTFIQRCLSSDSCIVRSIVNYGIYVGRMFSPVGQNVLIVLL